MKRDENWQKYAALDPRKYLGKYVVIAAGKVVGAGRDLKKLLLKAEKVAPGKVPFVGRVRDPKKLCVY